MKARKPETVGDCATGDVIRIDAGLVRVCALAMVGERWCRLLNADLSETHKVDWIKNSTRVLEAVRDQSYYAGVHQGGEVDPLLAEGGR